MMFIPLGAQFQDTSSILRKQSLLMLETHMTEQHSSNTALNSSFRILKIQSYCLFQYKCSDKLTETTMSCFYFLSSNSADDKDEDTVVLTTDSHQSISVTKIQALCVFLKAGAYVQPKLANRGKGSQTSKAIELTKRYKKVQRGTIARLGLRKNRQPNINPSTSTDYFKWSVIIRF